MNSKNLSMQTAVHPCVIDGHQTLVYERGLQEKEPISCQYISRFAQENGYQLKEDRRADFVEGVKRVKNKGHANLISVVVLAASLLSQNSDASSFLNLNVVDINKAGVVTQEQVVDGVDIYLHSYSTETEIAKELLRWINKHSSFTYNIDEIPKVIKVTAREMAEVAFGKRASLSQMRHKINGLYNFNEKAVYILDSIDLESDKGKSILLHELVHYMQYQHGHDKDVTCKNELESLAYLLQVKYLESQESSFMISNKHIDRVSQCRT